MKESSPNLWERNTSLPLIVQPGRKRLSLYSLDVHSNTFTSMKETKFARQSFLYERDGKELKDNP